MSMMIQPGRFGAPPSAGHRYWRVFITDNNGEVNYITVNELEMYSSDVDGPARVNRAVAGTPIYSTQGGAFGGDTAAGAFDNSNNTVWANTSGSGPTNAYLGYDFGAPIDIDRFAIRARATSLTQAPKNIRLDFSDDNATWTTLFTPAAQTAWADNEMRLFTAPSYAESYSGSPHGSHRYWRVSFSRAQSGSTYGLIECEMRATPSGADETGSGTASAHSEFSPPTYDAAKAFDNNSGTLWSANGNSGDGWLKYDFGSGVAKAIAEISLSARTGSVVGQSPVAGCVQFSDDNAEWSTAWEYALSNFTSGETKVITDPAYV